VQIPLDAVEDVKQAVVAGETTVYKQEPDVWTVVSVALVGTRFES
jgi:hypothetical protein